MQERFNEFKKKARHKCDLLEQFKDGMLQTGTILSQVVKSKGWTIKSIKNLKRNLIHSLKKPFKCCSQSNNEYYYVSGKDKADPSVVHKLLKLLLQVSIRELHNDLIESPKAQFRIGPISNAPFSKLICTKYKIILEFTVDFYTVILVLSIPTMANTSDGGKGVPQDPHNVNITTDTSPFPLHLSIAPKTIGFRPKLTEIFIFLSTLKMHPPQP